MELDRQLWLVLLVSDYLQGESCPDIPYTATPKQICCCAPKALLTYKFTCYPAYFNVIPTASLWQFGAQGSDVLFKFCIAALRKALGYTSWMSSWRRKPPIFQSEGKVGRTHENKRGFFFQLWHIEEPQRLSNELIYKINSRIHKSIVFT